MAEKPEGNRAPRVRWLVTYPSGETVALRHLNSARVDGAPSPGAPGGRHLTRLSRGRYYYVETWSTGAGLCAGVVMVTRVSVTRAERELVERPLPFEAPARADGPEGSPDGL